MKRAAPLAAVLTLSLTAAAPAQTSLKRPSEIPLTAESAAEVALSRSPSLKAARARARAEEADARAESRPENPRLVGDYKAGSGVGRTDLALTFDLWSLIGAGPRRRAADAAAEGAQARLAEDALALAEDAKSAVYAVEAASATLNVRREAARAALEFAERAKGPALDLDRARAEAGRAEIDADRAGSSLAAARSRLARLLRVPVDSGWWTEDSLPTPPQDAPDAAALAALAKTRRPERGAALAAARAAGQRARAWSSATAGAFRLGVAAERRPDGSRLAGPAFDLELPAFEAAKPGVDAARARADEAAARADEEDAELTAELETLRARLVAARDEARRWSGEVVPALAAIASKTGRPDDLRAEADARVSLVAALRDYWTARAALERAAGGSLPEGKT